MVNATNQQTVKFNRYYVTNGVVKARIWYSLDNHVSGRKVVTLYAKDYSRELGAIISAGYENDTDSQTDYFEKGRVRLFEDHPLYAAARAKAEQIRDERAAKAAA